MFKDEKTFDSEKSVKYVFRKSFKETDALVIVFSAFQKIGSPPSYNYVRTIEEFDCNKLFILDDFGARASYYLCENRDFSIERSVIKLIKKIIGENDIKTVISAGSSKGGYAAMYYGIKYGFDYIISASPQYLLGDYLLEQTRTNEVVKFMAGNDLEGDHIFLNTIMKNMIIKTHNKPNILIHLGKGEMHYQKHVLPLTKDLDDAGLQYNLDLGDYDKHSDVAKAFPPILKGKIREYIGYPSLDIEIQRNNVDGSYKFIAKTETDNKVAWYVYQNNKKIDAKNYSLDKFYDLKTTNHGEYKVKAFAQNEKGLKVSLFSEPIIIQMEQTIQS
ncbi:Two component regulator three Y domain-containing protein [Bacillus sp. 22446]|uniref:Two component regulator three Y domain-containing protein n=1 Tax=Bacillus sp. 22446 TaxID=3453918 RepID=UPI003F83FCCC